VGIDYQELPSSQIGFNRLDQFQGQFGRGIGIDDRQVPIGRDHIGIDFGGVPKDPHSPIDAGVNDGLEMAHRRYSYHDRKIIGNGQQCIEYDPELVKPSA
jgi:hypothetical protein